MTRRFICEGFFTQIQSCMNENDVYFDVTFCVTSFGDMSKLVGIPEIIGISSTNSQPTIDVPYFGRTVKMAGLVQTNCDITMRFKKLPLKQEYMLGNKVGVTVKNQRMKFIPMDSDVFIRDYDLQKKNRERKKRAKVKSLRIHYDSLF